MCYFSEREFNLDATPSSYKTPAELLGKCGGKAPRRTAVNGMNPAKGKPSPTTAGSAYLSLCRLLSLGQQRSCQGAEGEFCVLVWLVGAH